MNRLLVITTLVAFGSVSPNPGSAQDAANDGPRLTVRDVVLLEGSNYEKTMNARARVDSTLPRSLAGRRPVSKEASAMPLGMVTFAGEPANDVDVLVEYNGRVMTHIPSASSRMKRLLWGRLTPSLEAPENELRLPAGHWLTEIPFEGRLFLQSPSSPAAPYLIYDIEHNEAPLATISLSEGSWSAKNTGRDPITNVALFKPTQDGRYQLGVVDQIEGYRPGKKDDGEDGEAGDGKKVQPAVADPKAVKAVGAIVGNLMNAVSGTPAKTTTATAAPIVASKVEMSPGVAAEWSLGEPADAEDIIKAYVDQFADLGPTEKAYVAAVLRARCLKDRTASFVYQLDQKTLDRIIPLEVTPQPDRVVRVGLVIVTDADPSLAEEIDQLIVQLGDDTWAMRERAETRLRELGRVTERNLQAASSNSDAEIAYRAKRILADLKAAKL